MKHIFFKTVRNDYSSVWAIGKYRKVYTIGKRFTFPPDRPAHVFLMNETCSYRISPDSWEGRPLPEQQINHDNIYCYRAENEGNRVVICYGEVKRQRVPVLPIRTNWRMRDFNTTYNQYARFTCDDFVVLGEIIPSQGISPRDEYLGYKDYKVIGEDYNVIEPIAPEQIKKPIRDKFGRFARTVTPNPSQS